MEKIINLYQSPENKSLIYFQMCGITYPDKNYSITRKRAQIACIEYVESGKGLVEANNRAYKINGGDSYILHTGIEQHYYSDKENPWKKYFINVSGPLFENLVSSYKIGEHIHFPGLDIKKELVEIIDLCEKNPGDNTSEIVSVLTSVFHKMYEYMNKNEEEDAQAAKMREFIEIKTPDVFRIDELCKFMSLSESQTIRIFKRAYGKTPYAYFLERKLRLSKNLLTNTNLSIKQIARELNFADEYYFSNFFKEKTGISPKQYRNK